MSLERQTNFVFAISFLIIIAVATIVLVADYENKKITYNWFEQTGQRLSEINAEIYWYGLEMGVMDTEHNQTPLSSWSIADKKLWMDYEWKKRELKDNYNHLAVEYNYQMKKAGYKYSDKEYMARFNQRPLEREFNLYKEVRNDQKIN